MARKPVLSPRKQPRQARSRAMVETILTAATQVLETIGMDEMTTNQIAERAGVSVASVYQYFPNKQSIAFSLIERHLQDQQRLFDRIVTRHQEQAFTSLVDALKTSFTTRFLSSQALIRQLIRIGPQVNGLPHFVLATEHISHHMTQELLRRHPNFQQRASERRVFTLLHAGIGVMHGYLSATKQEITADELSEEMHWLMSGFA